MSALRRIRALGARSKTEGFIASRSPRSAHARGWFQIVTGLFLFWAISTLWHIRWVRRLPSLKTLTTVATKSHIKCSIVIAARDEAARIEQTIRRLLAQRRVELEIIVVDDRSTDGTSEILRGLAKEDSRLHVKRVDVLPDGWLGKCHACHVGASAATGDWILSIPSPARKILPVPARCRAIGSSGCSSRG